MLEVEFPFEIDRIYIFIIILTPVVSPRFHFFSWVFGLFSVNTYTEHYSVISSLLV